MDTETEAGAALSRHEYYKQMVDQLVASGRLEEERQRPISQATMDFLISRKKDPVSLLNIYCSSSGESKFEFYPFNLKYRGANAFLCITEFEGLPIFGICGPSKKEAKKSCALRLVDVLMSSQRLECISPNGRKIKRLPPKPLPTPLNMNTVDIDQQNAENEISFSDDIDLDGMKREFEKLNPLPDDCKDPKEFEKLRADAFRLHCENAFWHPITLSEPTMAKMAACRLANSPISFVSRCLTIANIAASRDDQSPTPSTEGSPSKSNKIEIDFVPFTLPYIPHQYACLANFDGQLYHGAISESKQKAKMSCAAVLCETFVQKGMADIKVKRTRSKSTPKLLAKKLKLSTEHEEAIKLEPYQYLLTLHPGEALDPATHFLLATEAKSPIQMLNEMTNLSFDEQTDASTGKFIARVDSVDGAEWGCMEETKKAAKCSAARKAIDKLVKTGKVKVSQEAFGNFRTAMAQFCKHFIFGESNVTG